MQNTDKIAALVLDQWLGFRARYADVPGFQACVRKNGALIFSKAYGHANLAKKSNYTTAHAGHIASHSKMFTACAALQLSEAGALSLQDPVVKYLPRMKKHKDKRFSGITVRDLMSNRSGIFRDGPDCAFWELERPFPSRAGVVAEIMRTKLVYKPGAETKYSNIGYSLLGQVLESAAGQSYDGLIRRQILDRLPPHGLMTDYGLEKGAVYAEGHSKKFYDGERKVFRHAAAGGMAAATGFCGNAESISLFLHALCLGEKLLPRRLRREMMSLNWPVKNMEDENYGLGLSFLRHQKETYVGHGGGYPGFFSQTRHWAGTDYIFSFILNANEPVTQGAVRSMAGIFKKVKAHFSERELSAAIVSVPVMNKWGATVYVVSGRRALGFPVETWLPGDDAFVLEKRGDGYYSDALPGYGSPGEAVQFIRKGKTIAAVNFGGYIAYAEKEFLRRSKKAFA